MPRFKQRANISPIKAAIKKAKPATAMPAFPSTKLTAPLLPLSETPPLSKMNHPEAIKNNVIRPVMKRSAKVPVVLFVMGIVSKMSFKARRIKTAARPNFYKLTRCADMQS